MNGTLGWGTWRRVWKDFDFKIKYDRDLLDEKLKSCYKMPYNIIKVLDHPNSIEMGFSDLKRMYKKSLKIMINNSSKVI